MQRSIDELRDIFALYQQGALTQPEFASMKQHLLDRVQKVTSLDHSIHEPQEGTT